MTPEQFATLRRGDVVHVRLKIIEGPSANDCVTCSTLDEDCVDIILVDSEIVAVEPRRPQAGDMVRRLDDPSRIFDLIKTVDMGGGLGLSGLCYHSQTSWAGWVELSKLEVFVPGKGDKP